MKPFALAIALIFTLNQAVFAQTGLTISPAREAQLMALAEQNPKEFLKNLTNDELTQVQRDLRALISGLQVDFSKAEAKDNNRLGYKIRKWGAISTVSIAALTVVGTIVRAGTFKGPSVDNDAVAILIFGGIITVGAAVITASGQMWVWLTPEEADLIQDKIDSLIALSNAIDDKL